MHVLSVIWTILYYSCKFTSCCWKFNYNKNSDENGSYFMKAGSVPRFDFPHNFQNKFNWARYIVSLEHRMQRNWCLLKLHKIKYLFHSGDKRKCCIKSTIFVRTKWVLSDCKSGGCIFLLHQISAPPLSTFLHQLLWNSRWGKTLHDVMRDCGYSFGILNGGKLNAIQINILIGDIMPSANNVARVCDFILQHDVMISWHKFQNTKAKK